MRIRPTALAAAILAASALVPGAASAGTVSIQGSKLVHAPSQGQHSRLGVTYKRGDENSKHLLVTEEGAAATVTAGPGCRRSGDAVECARDKVSTIVLLGGDGNDVLYNATLVPATLDGQAGADTLFGGWGADALLGGPGADTADYSYRTAALSVDLDGKANDGAAGEGDSVASDVESIVGGSADDRLRGGPGANRLSGGGGTDTLVSRDSGPDTVSCGDGSDSVAADPADLIDPDCESVDVQSASAAPPLLSAPHVFSGAKVSGQPITMTRDGRARVEVTCPAGRADPCQGTVTIRNAAAARATVSKRVKPKSRIERKGRKKAPALGRGRFEIAPSQTKTVSVKLSRNGRHRVRRRRRVRCSVNVSVRGPDGKLVVTSQQVTLKAPRRTKRSGR